MSEVGTSEFAAMELCSAGARQPAGRRDLVVLKNFQEFSGEVGMETACFFLPDVVVTNWRDTEE